MYIITGLGNPGNKYDNTRHNIGFAVIDALVKKYALTGPENKFSAEIYKGNINSTKIIAIKPTTYMNESGVAVQKALAFYKIPIVNLIVIHDELDLALGKIKTKIGGGAAGHNGIKSIDSKIGKNYQRIRVGIGHPGNKNEVTSYVLSQFNEDEKIKAAESIQNSIDLLPSLL